MDNQMNEILESQTEAITRDGIAPGEIIIGEFLGFNAQGEPLVIYAESENAMTAMSTVVITHEHKCRQVALLFANGDLTKPVIMGLIHSPLMEILNNVALTSPDEEKLEQNKSEGENNSSSLEQNLELADNTAANTAFVDGNKVVLEGKEEIVLKCGEASITLTKAGKIIIRGKYLLNRSSGVNRIMGGSVQVN